MPDNPDGLTDSSMDIFRDLLDDTAKGKTQEKEPGEQKAPEAPKAPEMPPTPESPPTGESEQKSQAIYLAELVPPKGQAKTIRVVVCDPDETSRAQIKLHLEPLKDVWLDGESGDLDSLTAQTAKQAAHVAIVALPSRDPEDTLARIRKLRASRQVSQVVVLSDRKDDPDLLRECMRAGASDYLVKPVQAEELAAALENVSELATAAKDVAATRRGLVLSVIGTTGGIGATTLAVNLGVGLSAGLDRKVVLVDMDLVRGDVDHMMDLEPQHSLASVAQNLDRMDFALLTRMLAPYSDRLHVLASPTRQERSEMITEDVLSRILQLLRANFTHTVIDLGRSLERKHWAAMEESDRVLVLTRCDVPALRHAVRFRREWTRRGLDIGKADLVLMNHPCDEPGLDPQKARDTLGADFLCQLPADMKSATRARTEGRPLLDMVPRSKLSREIVNLCETLYPVEEPAGAGRPSGLTGWFSGRGASP